MSRAVLDILIADRHDLQGAFTPLALYLNNGDVTFTRVMEEIGLDTHNQTEPPSPGARGFWMCLGLGDYDRDLDIDFFATNAGTSFDQDQEHGLFELLADGRYAAVETEAGIGSASPQFGWGCGFADFDNDAWLDLALTGSFPHLFFIGDGRGNPGQVFRNNGDLTFALAALPVDLSSRYTSGLGLSDYDGDGRVDIAIGTGPWLLEPFADPVLMRNVSTNTGHWLQIRLIGDGVSANADAIGARVWVIAGGVVQIREVRAGGSFLSQNSLTMHFGIRNATMVRRVFVRWPTGGFSAISGIPADRLITISQVADVHGGARPNP